MKTEIKPADPYARLTSEAVVSIMADPGFRRLVQARSRLRWGLSAATFVLFFGFVLLVSAGRQLFAIRAGATTIPHSIVAALLMDLALVILAAIYVYCSNARLDALAADVERSFGK